MGILIGLLWLIFVVMSILAVITLIVLTIIIYIKKHNEKREYQQSPDFDWKAKDIKETNIENKE